MSDINLDKYKEKKDEEEMFIAVPRDHYLKLLLIINDEVDNPNSTKDAFEYLFGEGFLDSDEKIILDYEDIYNKSIASACRNMHITNRITNRYKFQRNLISVVSIIILILIAILI